MEIMEASNFVNSVGDHLTVAVNDGEKIDGGENVEEDVKENVTFLRNLYR